MLSGGSFDKSYVKNQAKAHEDTVALFKQEIASGKDPPGERLRRCHSADGASSSEQDQADPGDCGVSTN